MPQRNFLILLAMIAISYACYVRGEQNPYARLWRAAWTRSMRTRSSACPTASCSTPRCRAWSTCSTGKATPIRSFCTEDEADPLRAEIRQQFGGIGVRIRFVGEPPRLMIVGPPDPGTPAARANLLPGDHILAIDGQPTANMTMADVLR